MNDIRILNAETHNLKGVSLNLPRQSLIVFTGVSGSGKSSLAFDTLYAEGQRRYLERMSTYARQFVQQLEKPPVEAIEGLSPTISIDQKTTQGSPRSTVGTQTEIVDYLRVLYARIGKPHCPHCHEPVTSQSPEQILERVKRWPEKTRIQVFSPVVRGRKGTYNQLFQQFRTEGFSRVRINGEMNLLDDLPPNYRLERQKTHTIDVVIDRLVWDGSEKMSARLHKAIEQAMRKSDGFVIVQRLGETLTDGVDWFCSRELACPNGHELADGLGSQELAPRVFSFNSPYGACQACDGLGLYVEIDSERLVPDDSLTLEDGAIVPLAKLLGKFYKGFAKELLKYHKIKQGTPWRQWPESLRHDILQGKLDDVPDAMERSGWEDDDWFASADTFEGVVPFLRRRYYEGTTANKNYIGQLMQEITCPKCEGNRLKPFALSVSLGDGDDARHIADFCKLSIEAAIPYVQQLLDGLDSLERHIGETALLEVKKRLHFLCDVGLGYLSLDRRASTLSGGESQRIRLASQLGSGLSGVLYVLDEPSIGLHPHNTTQLIETLKSLRDSGNTVLVVEHDEDTIRAADWLVDIGPKAGTLGGHISAQGLVSAVEENPASLTAKYLTGEKNIPVPQKRRKSDGEPIRLKGVTHNNLKNVSIEVPLNAMTAVTGLSGSGKSSLILDVLYPALRYRLGRRQLKPTGYDSLTGYESLESVVEIDQSPIGRTSRSTPATYMGLMDTLRALFANTELAKVKGYGPSRFSYNVAAGRCGECRGLGVKTMDMAFLANTSMPCDVCDGLRYNVDTLSVTMSPSSVVDEADEIDANRSEGTEGEEKPCERKHIADVLKMTVDEAAEFFDGQPKVMRQLSVLQSVGLGYIALGQSATTLSGGEAQRLKLAAELAKTRKGKTLYVLDEPTVGLHWEDVSYLMAVLNQLIEQGHTVVVIEHHPDVIKCSDYVIDLGPEAGEAGGDIVVSGTPEVVASCKQSLTGRYLRSYLN